MRNSKFDKQLQLLLMSSLNQKHVPECVAAITKMAYGKNKDQVLNRVQIILNNKFTIFPFVLPYFWTENVDDKLMATYGRALIHSSYAYRFCHKDLVRIFERIVLLNGRNDFAEHSNLIALFTSSDEKDVLRTVATKSAAIMMYQNHVFVDEKISEIKPTAMNTSADDEDDDNDDDDAGDVEDDIFVANDDDDLYMAEETAPLVQNEHEAFIRMYNELVCNTDDEDDDAGDVEDDIFVAHDDNNSYMAEETAPLVQNEYEALMKMYNKLVLNPDSFACGKCVEICAPMSGVLLQDCLHSYCRECIRDRILTNDGSELVACLNSQCDGFVQEHEIKSLLTSVELMNYEKRRKSAREANLEYNKLLNLDDVRMILPTYSFDCPVCTENCAAKNGIKLRNCLHNICQTCCKELVRLSDNACDIKCPICHSIIEEREIRGLLPPDQFTKYLQRVLRSSVQQLPNTFKCSTIDCDGFHIKEAGDLHFVCPLCDRRNCLQCKRIHIDENLTCAQNDEIGSGKELKSAELIKMMIDNGSAMQCPRQSCGAVITKDDGCVGMKCTYCQIEICWATKGPRWGPRGNGDTSGGCRCGINGKRCHPQCDYCH